MPSLSRVFSGIRSDMGLRSDHMVGGRRNQSPRPIEHLRPVSPRLLARGKGRIVNPVGGGAGTSFPNGFGYASSKAAVMRLTECLNDTTLAGGVLTFAVDPGLGRTAMTEKQLSSDAGKRYLPGIQQLFDDGLVLLALRFLLLTSPLVALMSLPVGFCVVSMIAIGSNVKWKTCSRRWQSTTLQFG